MLTKRSIQFSTTNYLECLANVFYLLCKDGMGKPNEKVNILLFAWHGLSHLDPYKQMHKGAHN